MEIWEIFERAGVAGTNEERAQYYEYLQSEHWTNFADEIRLDRGDRCENCGIDGQRAYRQFRQRLNVHHKTYERLGCEKPGDVELLCYGCHMDRHGLGYWIWFCQQHAMPDVEPIPLLCANCEKPTGEVVYNWDEKVETLCWECRH